MANELILIVEDDPKNLKLVRDVSSNSVVSPAKPRIAQRGTRYATLCACAFHRSLEDAHSAQTSERYEVGDGREWMDDAVTDETPKAGLREMLGTKPAFRHQ
jgi:hypothetical protein